MRLAQPYRPVGGVLVAAALVAAGLALAAPAAADTGWSTAHIVGQTLRAGHAGATTERAAPAPARPHLTGNCPTATLTGTSSTWTISYDSAFCASTHARSAFEAAVGIWSDLVASRVPISIDATSTALDPGVLGQAGPTGFVALNRDGLGGTAKTDYAAALANAVVGRDLSPGSDIEAQFDISQTDLYFGTDGQPQGKYDFETVVLHELGHGLGFLGSMDVDSDGVGFWGGGRDHPQPTIFDRFTVRSGGAIQGKRLLSYPTGSLALGSALTSLDVYWDGPHGKAAYSGRPPRLYAPRAWEPASSYSHLSVADFPQTDPNSLMTAVLSADEVKRSPGPVVLGMLEDMGWGVPPLPGVRYTPVDPVRIMDTRDGTGGLSGRLGAGKPYDLTVVGGSSGVPADATAVVLNVTGIGPATATDLRLYPTPRSGTAQPLASNLNLVPGAIRANLVTVPVGEDGKVRLLNSGGAPHVLVDVQGWYGPAGGSVYEPTAPVRLLDTREGTGVGQANPVEAGQSVDLTVTGGARSVPDTATAVVLTVTAVNATSGTDIRVYPTPADPSAAPPQISNLNVGPRQLVPNLVTAKVGAGGRVRLWNGAGSVDLVADLAGWYDQDAKGSLFHVLAPQRILDTRNQLPTRLGANQTRDVPVAGVAGVPATNATAVIVNLTGVDASQTTDVAAYPTPNDGSVPSTSNLNLLVHETAADLAIVATGLGGQIRLRNSAGDVAIVLDITGWFGP
ncbi:MAG: hypothetical protein QOI82_834 [Actinomycetota bacterium]|nr:hypothetical protein [Actinomycetota bacterium]